MAVLDVTPYAAKRPRRLLLLPASGRERRLAFGVSGATEQKNGLVTFPPEPFAIGDLVEAGIDLQLSAAARAWYDAASRNAAESLLYASSPLALLGDHEASPAVDRPPWWNRLYPYQQVGARWLRVVGRGILGDEMGVGKTIQALTAARDARWILVVTVNLAKRSVWERHVNEWMGRRVAVLDGSLAERADRLRAALDQPDGIIVINHEMLQTRNATAYAALWTTKWNVVILDEAQKFQDPNSQQSRGAAKLSAERLYLLTGTPVWNRPENIWNLLHLLDPLRWSSYWRFVDEFCETVITPWARDIVGLKPARLERLQATIAPVLLRRLSSDVLPDLPDKRIQTIEYELGTDQRRSYQALKREFRLLSETGALVKTVRSDPQKFVDMRTLCNAPLLLGISNMSSAKDAVLLDLLGGLLDEERKVVVFCWHRAYARYLYTRHGRLDETGRGVWIATGDMDIETRETSIQQFREHPGPGVLLATIAAVGTAIDITAASAAIFAEGSYVPTMIDQAEKRLHRIGQKTDVMIYRLAARNTIETAIWETVQDRKDMADELLSFSDVTARLLRQPDD